MSPPSPGAGHRARLRQRFETDPSTLSEAELLELLLTFAIPRLDVAPHARALLERYGSIEAVLGAPTGELQQAPGIGEQAATLIGLVNRLRGNPAPGQPMQEHEDVPGTPVEEVDTLPQPALFEMEPNPEPLQINQPESIEPGSAGVPDAQPEETAMRTFADDETANALAFIPQAARFTDLEAFRAFLRERLPYNSVSTRQRRASYIIERFFSSGQVDTPLAYFAAHCSATADLKPALFYHLAMAEPLLGKVADELVWPAVPLGHVDRDQVRKFILRYLPGSRPASQAKMLQSVFNAFTQLGVASGDGPELRFQMHTGTLESFLYVLTAEFPKPGMYSFEALENGPLRRRLLWDRDWMRRQIYNLRDAGVIAKVSEIDAMRQFTLALDQAAALRHYYSDPERGRRALREQPHE